jgi:hypothetical protein
MRHLFYFSFVAALLLAGCGEAPEKQAAPPPADSVRAEGKDIQPYKPTTQEITGMYNRAIAAYLRSVPAVDKAKMDTLFFGNHPDMPKSLELPAQVENVPLKMIDDWEHAHELLAYRRASVYINLIGAFLEKNADFIFVTFHTNTQAKSIPQHNCNVHFSRENAGQEFELDTVWFDYVYPTRKK